ncbi:MAG: alpha-galactosidase [Treponema sp.]|jgi:alpha-galactosidase|nr:alpha-galactosidase [Treponema sp.]
MQNSVITNFSFVYDGKKYSSLNLDKKKTDSFVKDGFTVTKETYSLDSIVITRERKEFGNNAAYSLLWFENTGNKKSKVLSDICDIDQPMDIDSTEDILPPPFCAYGNIGTKIYPTVGCSDPWSANEFNPREDRLNKNGNRYSCTGGRSSQVYAPFFEVHNGKDKGFILAIGWTGQWFAYFKKDKNAILVNSGIDNLNFYLKPGEKIRTASILYLEYSGPRGAGYNQFRRIVKDYFSPYGRKISKEPAPLSMLMWGGATPEYLIGVIEKAVKEKLGFEYFWIDAGWYGDYESYCPDAYTGDWWKYVGDWHVNRRIHNKELRDVMKAAENAGMKTMLWLEPERAYNEANIIAEEPGLFIRHPDKNNPPLSPERNMSLLDLSLELGQKWMINIISHYVEDLHLTCYRQDFNLDPLVFWNSRDTADRMGITQIKYIMGMYHVWDTLLEKYPELLIDNCASGGRRIDIETLSRSVPLWRSDTYCSFNFNPNWAQSHNIGISRFLPYSGCGIGRFPDDKYRFRSCHAAGLQTDFLGYDAYKDDISYDMSKIKSLVEEYKSVRDYYSCDYYPVFGFPTDDTTWGGWQFDRPETGSGIIMAFRRDQCLADKVRIFPGGISADKKYYFENIDTGEVLNISGSDLIKSGFDIHIPVKRDSRLIRYRVE